MRIAEFRKGVFCEIKIAENVLVVELCQLNRVLDHHAHKPRCVLQEEIEAIFYHCFGRPTLPSSSSSLSVVLDAGHNKSFVSRSS